jgi:hypothetical protein
MRTLHKTLASLGILAMAAMGQITGCSNDADDCALNGTCNADGTPYGNKPPPGCEKSPKDDPSVIKDECGIFVSASVAVTGNGTKDKPFKTLKEGIDAAGKKAFRVYACAETYAEEASLKGVSLFGGFDCAAGWAYSDKKATIAPMDGVPVRVSGGGDLKVEDVVAQAPDYSAVMPDAMAPAKSSIATIVDGANVAFARCNLMASAGQNGADGESPAADAALNGAAGNPGINACDGDVFNGKAPGGAEATKTCGDSSTTTGGKGGDGGVLQMPATVLAGGDGADGQPALAGGKKGLGEPVSGSWSCVTGAGQVGDNGTDGDPGPGATGTGTIGASGYVPPMAASSGKFGTPGQGGGGGGGAKGGTGICSPGGKPGTGASGGSGGSGGCGGKGGGGGAGGGASIALVSLKAAVVLVDCTLNASTGGNGGSGGKGQAGGNGGDPGKNGSGAGGSKNACSGGPGGQGGNGGPGGGGAGGPSIGVAHVGNAPEQRNTMVTPGTGGKGGAGGNGDAAGQGADAMGEAVHAF